MIGDRLARTLPGERRFRWRGGDVSRLEAIVDTAFAFALTLLLVTTDAPMTYDGLIEVFVQLPVLLVTFTLLILVWHEHFVLHRRYGLEDALTRVLNFAALFLVLVYVFPLKFLFHTLWNQLVLGRDWKHVAADGTVEPVMRSMADFQVLMALYGLGGAAVFGLFALLFRRAWRMREALGLDAVEAELTRGSVRGNLVSVGVSLVSVLIAATGPGAVPWAGCAYGLMWPGHVWNGVRTAKRIERLERAGRGSGGNSREVP